MVAASERPLMVLYPHGPPAPEHAELCTRLVLLAGGDLSRVHDGPFASIGRFIAYAQRIPIFRDAAPEAEWSMVLLTTTAPLRLCVLEARHAIEAAIPVLSRALWAIFVDPRRDPLFAENAAAFGAVDRALGGVGIWHTTKDGAFLVLSPDIKGEQQVRIATRRLRDGGHGAAR